MEGLDLFLNSEPPSFIDPSIHFHTNHPSEDTEIGVWSAAEKTDAFVFSNSPPFAGDPLKHDAVFIHDIQSSAAPGDLHPSFTHAQQASSNHLILIGCNRKRRHPAEDNSHSSPEVIKEKETTSSKATKTGPSSKRPDRFLKAIRAFQRRNVTEDGCLTYAVKFCRMRLSTATNVSILCILVNSIADCFFHEKSSGIRITNVSDKALIEICSKRVKPTRILNLLPEARGHEELYLTYRDQKMLKKSQRKK